MTQDTRVGLSVLVVDDDEVMRELLSALLEAAGHRVQTADSATAGLARLEEESRLDVVLTDLHMPDTDAYAMLQAWRNTMRGSTGLIGMSGSDAEAGQLELLDDFLLKPFSTEDFQAAAERARAGASGSTLMSARTVGPHVPVLDEVIYKQMSKALPATALQELYELTLDDVKKRAQAMRAAAASGDADTCKSEAHAMKGGCGMVGAMELRAIAADIETGSPVDTPVLAEIDSAAERLRRMLDTLT